jgi:NCAIR mutase (PurE)-related protein
MRTQDIAALLEAVREGSVEPAKALEELRTLPFRQAAGILADTHRLLRQGFPEAVFAEGKTVQQVGDALELLWKAQGAAIATRVSNAFGGTLRERFPEGTYDELSRLFVIGSFPRRAESVRVGVICAGTSDLPVGEEVAQVLEFGGCAVMRITDIGVAGLHRLLARLDDLRTCRVLVVVAGMEGALPGVIGGLVACPVIAVPTSVGYGSSFKGVSALLTMLNTCASGLAVVNIDNGYGAAVAVQRILSQIDALSE